MDGVRLKTGMDTEKCSIEVGLASSTAEGSSVEPPEQIRPSVNGRSVVPRDKTTQHHGVTRDQDRQG